MSKIHVRKKKYGIVLEVDENVYGQGKHGVIAISRKFGIKVKGSSRGEVYRKMTEAIQLHLGI